MSGYFAGLMRQTGIGAAAAPSPLSAPSPLAAAPAAFTAPDAPAPLEQDVVVDAAPAGRDASADLPRPQPPAPPFSPAAPPSAAAPPAAPAPPPGAPAPPPFATAPAGPRPRSDAADPASFDLPARTIEPPAPLEVTDLREASPPPPRAVPPTPVTEYVPVPFTVDAPASARGPVPPPPPAAPLIEVVERMVAREAEAGPGEPPVRGIPDERPRTPAVQARRGPAVPPRGEPPVAEVADETPAPPPARVHSFAEVLAEARRWVAATPAPGEAARVQVEAAEADAFAPAPAGTRPRRPAAGVAEVSEEVHVSIGAITVTIEDPAAARPAPRAEAPRAEPDWRSRLARHYLRPE